MTSAKLPHAFGRRSVSGESDAGADDDGSGLDDNAADHDSGGGGGGNAGCDGNEMGMIVIKKMKRRHRSC